MDIVYRMLKVLNADQPTNYEISKRLHISRGYLADIKNGKHDPYKVSLRYAIQIAALYEERMK